MFIAIFGTENIRLKQLVELFLGYLARFLCLEIVIVYPLPASAVCSTQLFYSPVYLHT